MYLQNIHEYKYTECMYNIYNSYCLFILCLYFVLLLCFLETYIFLSEYRCIYVNKTLNAMCEVRLSYSHHLFSSVTLLSARVRCDRAVQYNKCRRRVWIYRQGIAADIYLKKKTNWRRYNQNEEKKMIFSTAKINI